MTNIMYVKIVVTEIFGYRNRDFNGQTSIRPIKNICT